MSAEQRQALSEMMKAKWASLSPEEHAAAMARFRDPLQSEHAREQLTKFWSGCTGEERARKCAHLTNPEAQAKSHEAQRTPEFRARRSAWAKAAWAGLTPEERKEKARKLREVRDRKRAERGLPPIQPKPPRATVKRGSPEFRQMMSEKIKAHWAKYHAEHPQPPKPVRPPKVVPTQLTPDEQHAARSAAHRKAVVAVPKDGGETLRFDSALSAADALYERGLTMSKRAAMLLIGQSCHGHRKSAFGYQWTFAPAQFA